MLLAQVLFGAKLGYDALVGIFSQQWMRFATFVVIVALAWHAWVGMRDIWMDYVKPVWLRLALAGGHHRLAGRLRRLGGAGVVETLRSMPSPSIH